MADVLEGGRQRYSWRGGEAWGTINGALSVRSKQLYVVQIPTLIWVIDGASPPSRPWSSELTLHCPCPERHASTAQEARDCAISAHSLGHNRQNSWSPHEDAPHILMVCAALAACSGRSDEELLAAAAQRMQANDPGGASIELKNLLQRSPDNARPGNFWSRRCWTPVTWRAPRSNAPRARPWASPKPGGAAVGAGLCWRAARAQADQRAGRPELGRARSHGQVAGSWRWPICSKAICWCRAAATGTAICAGDRGIGAGQCTRPCGCGVA